MRRPTAIRLATAATALSFFVAAPAAWAQESPEPTKDAPAQSANAPAQSARKATDLFELLDNVELGLEVEQAENLRRVEDFRRRQAEQARLLAEAKATLAEKEELSQRLETVYNQNESGIGESQQRLTERLGELGELFGVVRQVANDASGQVLDSLASAQLGTRQDVLDRLGRSTELPTTDDLEQLWFELQREMTQQGEVVRFRAPVLTTEGLVEEQEVVRAGVFSAVANGQYLLWDAGEGKLAQLTRQPPAKYVETIAPFESLQSGFGTLAVDPSRGQLLNALTDTPNLQERVNQGGAVGYVILALGALALVLGLTRLVVVLFTSARVNAQQKRDELSDRNPLGRVLAVYEEHRDSSTETLELKLDEAVLRETTRLQRLMWLVKTVSVVAPLLGLLGTVTGMIQTFQAITLFGAGDPKMMAGGISEALVTTMLGLVTAIPLVLLYDTLSNTTRRVTDVLDEQSAGLIASRSEQESQGL